MDDETLIAPRYVPPRRAFWRCRWCRQVVLKTADGEKLTPLLGIVHMCQPHPEKVEAQKK